MKVDDKCSITCCFSARLCSVAASASAWEDAPDESPRFQEKISKRRFQETTEDCGSRRKQRRRGAWRCGSGGGGGGGGGSEAN